MLLLLSNNGNLKIFVVRQRVRRHPVTFTYYFIDTLTSYVGATISAVPNLL